TEPLLPTSSSTPTSLVNEEHCPPTYTSISLGACAPTPLAYVTPPIVIVWPSFEPVSPLLRSLSGGPQPLVALVHGTSLTYAAPEGGALGTSTCVLPVVLPGWVPSSHRNLAVAVRS